MNCGCPCAVQGGGVRRMRAGGHSAVGRRHGGHLPLEELQDHVDIRCHTGLQPGKDEGRHQQMWPQEFIFMRRKHFNAGWSAS